MKMKQIFNFLFHTVFWLWNLTFLLIVYAGILPLSGVLLIVATFAGEIPIDFFFTLVGLVVVPTACTLVGWVRLRQQPLELMRLFYGVEAPLFLLCLIRLFLLRELTPASTQIIGTVVLCILAFSVELLYSYAGRRGDTFLHRALSWTQLICHSLMLLVGVYVGVLLLFYAMPAGYLLLREFCKFEWLKMLGEMLISDTFTFFWWGSIFFLLFAFSSTLFVLMPSALASLYIQSGRRILLAFASQYGRTRALGGAGAVVTASLLVFISLQQQPQIQALTLLDRPAPDDSSRQALLAKSEVIQEGLVNAYLSPYRYLSTRNENNHIRAIYSSVFGMPNSASQFLQDSYDQLMSPFLYNGSDSEVDKAEKLYAQFFDAPIQKAERQAIQHALQSTYNRGEAKAGLLKINQKNVWLAKQQVTIEPHGDWADVELYEVYENQTSDVQEVFYSFSLPESATVTGLWLGDTDNRNSRFPHTVSPRGAAQKVYTQQVKREEPVDPALIEQVGPRHYRLRAFPVPPRLFSNRGSLQQQPQKLHLWLTYKVMQQEAGWPMPQLGEKRNVFWTNDTKRIFNGQVVADQKDAWLPLLFPAVGQHPPALHQVTLPGGDRILAKPLVSRDYSLPQGKRFAVVLDGSRSMAAHMKEITQTFKWLKEQGLAKNDADLYVTASASKQPQRLNDIRRFDPAKMTFYGTIQLKEMLQQFAQLRGNTPYDAILLMTDEGSYELSDDSNSLPTIPAPLWMVHMAVPPAYDDATLKVIQDSSGGVSTEIPEVMRRLATQAALGSSVVSVVDGYAWSMEKTEQKSLTRETTQNLNRKGFEPVAARQLVLGLSKEKVKDQLVQLDAIHALAKNFDIVTPYSSMIVLVNDQQREALKQAEVDKDRFNRKVENGKEQLTKPYKPLHVSGVPEPKDGWLISIVTCVLLLVSIRQRRKKGSYRICL